MQYQVVDHLGSSHFVVDNTATFIRREEYDPYGETSFGSFAKKRYRFTGKERDEESGLNYHGARYYACWSARWVSADPAGTVEGLNLFTYARGNPLAFTDVSGTQSVPETTSPQGASPPPQGTTAGKPPPGTKKDYTPLLHAVRRARANLEEEAKNPSSSKGISTLGLPERPFDIAIDDSGASTIGTDIGIELGYDANFYDVSDKVEAARKREVEIAESPWGSPEAKEAAKKIRENMKIDRRKTSDVVIEAKRDEKTRDVTVSIEGPYGSRRIHWTASEYKKLIGDTNFCGPAIQTLKAMEEVLTAPDKAPRPAPPKQQPAGPKELPMAKPPPPAPPVPAPPKEEPVILV